MLFHPYALQLLQSFKISTGNDIPKELLCLLLEYKSYIDLDVLYEYLFLHKNNVKGKSECMKILKNSIKKNFNYVCIKNRREYIRIQKEMTNKLEFILTEESEKKEEYNNGENDEVNKKRHKIREEYGNPIEDIQKIFEIEDCYFIVKNNDELSLNYFSIMKSLKQDFSKKSKKNESKVRKLFYSKKGEFRDNEPRNIVKREKSDENIEDSNLESLILKLSERLLSDKRKFRNILNKLKEKINMKDNKENIKETKEIKRHTPRDSLLSFITKEKISMPKYNLFTPISFEDNIYVYKCNNPNYASLRVRKDLIKPTKKMYVNFTFESRPSIYTISGVKIKCKNSLKMLNNVDYDEESTWEDDLDGEVINSDDSEEDDESSCAEEWIEEDSCTEETKNLKKPTLSFPDIKIDYNVDYEDIFRKLPLKIVNFVPDFLLNKIDHTANVKEISHKYLISEAAILKFLKKNE